MKEVEALDHNHSLPAAEKFLHDQLIKMDDAITIEQYEYYVRPLVNNLLAQSSHWAAIGLVKIDDVSMPIPPELLAHAALKFAYEAVRISMFAPRYELAV